MSTCMSCEGTQGTRRALPAVELAADPMHENQYPAIGYGVKSRMRWRSVSHTIEFALVMRWPSRPQVCGPSLYLVLLAVLHAEFALVVR